MPWFLGFAFGWTWLWVFLAALARAGRLDLPMRGDLGVLLARYGPGLAALACLGLGGGRRAAGELLGRLGRLPARPGWLVFALAMDLPLYLATFALGARGDARFPAIDGSMLAALPGVWLPAFAASFVTSGVGEELGWRGLLLPRLLRRRGPLAASLLLVPVIGLWHLDAGAVARGLTDGWPAFLAVHLPALARRAVLTLPSECIFTLLYLRGRGSLLLMAAAHAAINASYAWASACQPDQPPRFWLLYAALLWGVGAWAAVKLAREPAAAAT